MPPPPSSSFSSSRSEEGKFRPDQQPFDQQQMQNMTEPHVPWPRQARQVLARVPTGGDPGRLPKGLMWKKCDGLKEVDNIYDLGFKENLKLVLWPRKM